jgi:hypothetical protein
MPEQPIPRPQPPTNAKNAAKTKVGIARAVPPIAAATANGSPISNAANAMNILTYVGEWSPVAR